MEGGSHTVDPLVPLAFLAKLVNVLESYVGGVISEMSIKVSCRSFLPPSPGFATRVSRVPICRH